MEFNKAYNRNELVKFLRTNFLPEDFIQEETTLDNPKQFQYTQQVTRLGECNSLELVVFEVLHSSVSDARVGLTKEAFRMLADEFCERALVFFVPQDDNSNYRFSLIEITLEQKEGSAKVQRTFSNPHRYSYYLGEGISYHTPNKYLNEAGRVVSIEDLRSRFSVEVLTKAFYQELSDWYAWAVKIVRFPNDLKTEADNEKYNSEAMIRLITRLIFVWFIKQRKLVPDEFFDVDYISARLIKDFNPSRREENLLSGNSVEYSLPRESHYYKGILQNLFFAMLNRPICEEGSEDPINRRFSRGQQDFGINNVMRHENLFIDSKHFIKLANRVPFLNGGLFDCLDDKDNRIYIDAFTDRDAISKQLVVPDALFFGEGPTIDLSEWYGDKRKKKVSARGIIDILKRYNFTVEENTPFDQDVSLDPELLGKVFENLLASYNPETQTTARKQTGSFYTPREIVQYMVDESLVAHLKRTVGADLEAEYRKLIQYTDEEPNLTNEQRKAILQSIYQCKVLDPACGSGAFPMGMLQQMVHILNRIDPDNKEWKNMMVKNAISETSEAYLNATDDERKEMVADIERSFNENVNRPDYARKLYLIENCIYGVDIQPIAIQISKLRFFISLVVDQKTNDNPVDNFGIRPLPNLEAKFVAANTLIGLHNQTNLFVTDDIKRMQDEIKVAKHKIFGAKTVKTKRKYKERVAQLRIQMVEELKRLRAVSDEDHLMLLDWDMFDQNKAATFFDPNWMFGIDGGFDIVIGNPPYGIINKKQNKGESISVSEDVLVQYKCSEKYAPAQGGMLNIFRLFVVQSVYLLKKQGVFSEIFPLAFACDISASKLRIFVQNTCTIISFEAFPERDNPKKRVFENAKMSVCILTMYNIRSLDTEYTIRINKDKYVDKSIVPGTLSYSDVMKMDGRYYTIPLSSNEDLQILKKIYRHSIPFIHYGKCNTGEIDMTFCKNAFTIDDSDSRMIRGANIDRYLIKTAVSQGENLFLNEVRLKAIKEIDKDLFYNQRIVMQGITGVNERTRLKMSISSKAYCANSVNYLTLNDENRSFYFLGLLNSKLLNYIFKQFSTNSNVNGYEVDNLPIILSENNEIDRLSTEAFTDKMNGHDSSTKELSIDLSVYHLYNLTYDEVLIVDSETPITREEYESK